MFEKRNVRRNPGGVSTLTCTSFDTLGEGSDRQKPNHLTADSLRSFPPDNWSLTGKVNDWGNREHVVLDLFSNIECLNLLSK